MCTCTPWKMSKTQTNTRRGTNKCTLSKCGVCVCVRAEHGLDLCPGANPLGKIRLLGPPLRSHDQAAGPFFRVSYAKCGGGGGDAPCDLVAAHLSRQQMAINPVHAAVLSDRRTTAPDDVALNHRRASRRPPTHAPDLTHLWRRTFSYHKSCFAFYANLGWCFFANAFVI